MTQLEQALDVVRAEHARSKEAHPSNSGLANLAANLQRQVASAMLDRPVAVVQELTTAYVATVLRLLLEGDPAVNASRKANGQPPLGASPKVEGIRLRPDPAVFGSDE